ncbi:hypothetical protein EHP00_1884 [Ecytonucleospora hepatopenaei]|uniref:ISXO2-like transposase domain-containing protein n=1 Tax=Ecytonucleospora hepatopenaei TaxID=646526 RepID=A0A1W0E7I1_9MICR|nr:hypothetical protein EHP00_1884 [Ecytonucleospora hepatopenaei]
MIDISSNPHKISLHLVEDRSAATLLPIINNVCSKDTIIHSDSWKSYNGISRNFRFSHKTVNHTNNFVDPETGVHTQNIECLWNSCNYFIKQQKGIVGEKLEQFLCERMWKQNVAKSICFEAALNLLKEIY